MIIFKNNIADPTYIKFRKLYDKAIASNQKLLKPSAFLQSLNDFKEVDSRYVNLKIVDGNSFIFFSNYNSPKALQFKSHEQVALAFYWSSTNTQIRMRGNIYKSSKEISDCHFHNRSDAKNALAITSSQSKKIDSYKTLLNKYEKVLAEDDLTIRPNYWGGFSFIPYYFEFWKGHENRINKREIYELRKDKWILSFLQP